MFTILLIVEIKFRKSILNRLVLPNIIAVYFLT